MQIILLHLFGLSQYRNLKICRFWVFWCVVVKRFLYLSQCVTCSRSPHVGPNLENRRRLKTWFWLGVNLSVSLFSSCLLSSASSHPCLSVFLCRCFSLREASLSTTRFQWWTSLRDTTITTTTGRRRTWTGSGKAWQLWAESTSCFWSNTSWRWEKCTKTRNRRSESDPISFHVCFFTLSSVLIDLN